MKRKNYKEIKTIYEINNDEVETFRATDGRFHYFYKIVNNINDKFYYGIHSTDELDDNYCGSGSLLKYAYNKYGIENFTKYILCFFDDRKSLLDYEKYIVNNELVNENKCYNLTVGGIGSKDIFADNSYTLHTTKGLIHINNGIINKLIKETDLNNYIKLGWVTGQTIKSTKGKIVIHKEGHSDKFIFKDELNTYLENGWKLGGCSRNKGNVSDVKNKIWVNNGEKCIRIDKKEKDIYLSNNWVLGPLQRTTKGYIRITNGNIDKNIAPENNDLLNFYLNNGWKIGSCTKHNNVTWVTKNNSSKMIKKDELNTYLANGWENKRIAIDNKQKGKISVYKDNLMKYIMQNELDEYLSNGWQRGNFKRIKK